MSYTKGEWQLTTVPFELRSTDSAASIYGPMSRDGGACLIADISRSCGDEEATANAKLISAAPDLLESAQEIDLLFDSLKAFRNCDLHLKLKQAIKKATE